MQWLIDTIKDWINAQGFLTAGFVDRGDPAAVDYVVGNFTKDGAWHDLDLSGIVPDGAKTISVRVTSRPPALTKSVAFRKKGNANEINISEILGLVAVTIHETNPVIIPDVNRVIEYKIDAGIWTTLNFTVKGWWL